MQNGQHFRDLERVPAVGEFADQTLTGLDRAVKLLVRDRNRELRLDLFKPRAEHTTRLLFQGLGFLGDKILIESKQEAVGAVDVLVTNRLVIVA